MPTLKAPERVFVVVLVVFFFLGGRYLEELLNLGSVERKEHHHQGVSTMTLLVKG